MRFITARRTQREPPRRPPKRGPQPPPCSPCHESLAWPSPSKSALCQRRPQPWPPRKPCLKATRTPRNAANPVINANPNMIVSPRDPLLNCFVGLDGEDAIPVLRRCHQPSEE